MKRHLGISSTEFLKDYTVPYEMEKDGIAGVKFRPVEDGTACRFMKPEGCEIYESRPTACRYYPVALLSMRKQDEYIDRDSYAIVKEDHCKGHEVKRSITIADYRKEQGLEEYDDLARGWRQLVLKKKSSGPTIGKPTLRSRQLSLWPVTISTAFASLSAPIRLPSYLIYRKLKGMLSHPMKH
jgi:Fe-S-cluster containining protein